MLRTIIREFRYIRRANDLLLTLALILSAVCLLAMWRILL